MIKRLGGVLLLGAMAVGCASGARGALEVKDARNLPPKAPAVAGGVYECPVEFTLVNPGPGALVINGGRCTTQTSFTTDPPLPTSLDKGETVVVRVVVKTRGEPLRKRVWLDTEHGPVELRVGVDPKPRAQ